MFDKDTSYLDKLEETQKGKYLTFSLGDEYYGIEILFVTEIIGIQPITVMPELPDYMRGVINLRGEIVPVLDARSRFGKVVLEYNERTCIIVVNVSGLAIGIIVDAVSEVLIIDEHDIVPPPILFNSGLNYIKAIGKNDEQVVLILDCTRILSDDELDLIRDI